MYTVKTLKWVPFITETKESELNFIKLPIPMHDKNNLRMLLNLFLPINSQKRITLY